MKKFFYLLLALALCACGTKSEENQMNLKEDLEQLVQCIMDSSMHFEDYQPLFDEVLDSIEADVLHNPDAGTRFAARKTPNNLLLMIRTSESVEKRDSISQLYDQRNRDILYTWYVQQLIDSTDNSPFTLLSYAAPYDTNGNETHVSFTFSENTKTESKPVLFITLPRDAYEDEPLVMFMGDKPDKDYCHKDGNMDLYGSKEEGLSLGLYGDFLNDMLSYNQIRVIYMNENVKNYPNIKDAPYDECLTQVAVDLTQFQKQYQAAHKWMEDYK